MKTTFISVRLMSTQNALSQRLSSTLFALGLLGSLSLSACDSSESGDTQASENMGDETDGKATSDEGDGEEEGQNTGEEGDGDGDGDTESGAEEGETSGEGAGCYDLDVHMCSCDTDQESCEAEGKIWTDQCACEGGNEEGQNSEEG